MYVLHHHRADLQVDRHRCIITLRLRRSRTSLLWSLDREALIFNQPTTGKRYLTICFKYDISVMSALMIPLLVAVFTAVITFEQNKDSIHDRICDPQLAREER